MIDRWVAKSRRATVVSAVIGLSAVVGLQSSSQDGASFAALLWDYRRGDPERAVGILASWPLERVEAESRRVGQLPPWDAVALATLHIEAAIRRNVFGHWIGGEMEIHEREAFELIDSAFRRVLGDESLGRAIRDWHVAELSQNLAAYWPTQRTADLARRRFPNDARIRLLDGARAEYWIVERRLGAGDSADQGLTSTRHGNLDIKAAREAEAAYRRALDLDPALVEARLRLGRVLYLLDRTQEAERVLVQTLEAASAQKEDFSAYLAALFLGRISEDAGRSEEAAAHYWTASRVLPYATSARVALGALKLDEGDWTGGWSQLRAATTNHDAPGQWNYDPWAVYPYAQYYKVPLLLESIRATVRSRPRD